MSPFSFLSSTTACTVLLLASPAFADLSVDDAWNTWKAQIRAMGLTLQAEEGRDGDDLQIGKMTVSAEFPMESGSFSASFAGPRFMPKGDGTVNVAFPTNSQISFQGEIKDEGSLGLALSYKMLNSHINMSGTPDRVVSTWGAEGAEMSLLGITVDDLPLKNASGNANIGAYTYKTVTTFGSDLTIDQSASYDAYDWKYGYETEADGIRTTSEETVAVAGVTMTQNIVLPLDGIDMMGLPTQLRDGLKYSGEGRTSSYVSTQKEMQGNSVVLDMKADIADYTQTAILDHNGIRWFGTNGEISADIEADTMPVPISLTIGSAAGDIFAPLLKSEDPQAAGLQMELRDITFNPDLWAMVDPEGQLPRDPMTFLLDLAGQFDITADLLNFAMLAVLDDTSGLIVPVSTELKSLLLSAVGTELTGDGAFTFDASDTETFDGMPRPEGRMDLKLTGSNALIDTLLAMGLLPEGQAMSARMMMGLFATPGEGEDTLTSAIEINEQGHVLANGQRLK